MIKNNEVLINFVFLSLGFSSLIPAPRKWISTVKSKFIEGWQKGQKQIGPSSSIGLKTMKKNPFWSSQDEQDLAELIQLKVTNGTTSLNDLIESSIVDIGDHQEQQRQFIDGTCTCASASFDCLMKTFASLLSGTVCPAGPVDANGCTTTNCAVTVTETYYSCSTSSTCSTVCTSVSVNSCGSSCTKSTTLTATYHTSYKYYSAYEPLNPYGTSVGPGGVIIQCTYSGGLTYAFSSSTSSLALVNSDGCQSLSTVCSTATSPISSTTSSTTITSTSSAAITIRVRPSVVVPVVAAAVAIAVGVGVGVRAAKFEKAAAVESKIIDFLGGESGGIASTPFNELSIPVEGFDFINFGGCDDGSILFVADGICYPVLRRGPCPGLNQWITVDPISLQGKCSPRLCGRGRVFVGRDGLCHDQDDPFDCRGGRRLYYTAYGDPICDCPPNQFPFPTPQDDCVALFTRGPCREGEIVSFHSDGSLACSLDRCRGGGANRRQQLFEFDDGSCYPLGSSGPCSPEGRPSFSLLGFNVFELKVSCVPFTTTSPNDVINPQISLKKKHSDYGPLQHQIKRLTKPAATNNRLSELLNPCRPGARNGNNFKCANSIV